MEPLTNKALINTALYKEQLKRFWFIGALALLAYLLCVALPLYRSVSQPYELRNQITHLIRLLSMRDAATLCIGTIAPLVTALTLFAYQFQPRATTVLHALPFNKKQLFFTHTAAGLTIIAVPLLLLCAALLIPIRYPSPDVQLNQVSLAAYGWWDTMQAPAALFPRGLAYNAVINTPLVVAGFFVRMLIIQVFLLAVFTLAACLAGNAVVAFLCAGALPLVPLGLYVLAVLFGSYYLFGFSQHAIGALLQQALPYIYPLALSVCYDAPTFTLGETLAQTPVVTPVWPLLILHGAVSAVLLTLACLCFHQRRQERAGDSIVFNPLRILLVFLLSLTGALLTGAWLLRMMRNIPALYIGYAVGFVLAYFAAQMIAEKCVNVLYKARYLPVYGGIMALLFLAAAGVTRFDWPGYARYVPDDEEVAGVYLSGSYTYFQYSRAREPFHFITDDAVIADTLTLHRDITYNRHELYQSALRRLSGQTDAGYETMALDFLYLLNDGSVVSRQYVLPYAFVLRPEGVNAYDLLAAEAVILSPYHDFNALSGIESAVVEFYDHAHNQHHEVKVYLPGAIPSLAEALKKDILLAERMSIDERRRFAEQYVQLGHAPQTTPETEAATPTGYSNWYGYLNRKDSPGLNTSRMYFSLGSGEHTRAWIEANGYFAFDDE